MQPENKVHHQEKKFNREQKKQIKKLPKHVFAFLNSIIFDSQIDHQKDRLASSVQNLNNELNEFKSPEFADLLDSIINTKQKLVKTLGISHLVIGRIFYFKIKPVFFNAYISVIKKHRDQQDGLLNQEKLKKLAYQMKLGNLPYFYEAFKIQLDDKLVQQAVQTLSKSGQYKLAFKIVQQHQNKKFLIDKIANNALQCEDFQTISYVINEISNLGFGKNQYKKLHEKGLRQQMKSLYYNEGPFCAEEVYRYNPILMKMIANLMLTDKQVKKKAFLSFCARNPMVIDSLKDGNLIKEVQMLDRIEVNPLQNDIFGPSDPKKYMRLQELGINEPDVFFVNSGSSQLSKYLDDIVESRFLGLDTQSYVARTGFCTDLELIATIQISNGKRAYIFDAKDIKNPQIGNKLSKFFYDPTKTLVGHTLKQDLSSTLQALGITEKYKCQCIDVKHIFKQLYPNQRVGLQNICEVVLKKPICKEYTLTDWGRRPLLKNQIHYAALDAVCVLHIEEKLRDKMRVMRD